MFVVVLLTAALLSPVTCIAQSSKLKPVVSAPQAIHEDYTSKIREYTTEKFFLTELVDRLPKSDKVPSPEKVLGYVVGTPDKLTYTKDINRYMRGQPKGEGL
jgi:hypothetical protein